MGSYADQGIFHVRLRILDEDVEVAVIVEDAGIKQLILWLVITAPLVLLAKLVVRERSLRVFVETLAVAVRRKGIQIIELLFDVFAVVALWVAQAKEPLLQSAVLSIPQDRAEAESALPIRPTEDAVFTPPIRTVLSHLIRERVPYVAVIRVVLANGAPLALR